MSSLAPLHKAARQKQRTMLLVGLFLLAALAILSVARGAVSIPLPDVLSALARGFGVSGEAGRADLVVLSIRLPRTALVMLVGAALALSGAVMQGLFRNPLADPGLVGVSAGAALAAGLMIVLGEALLVPRVGKLPFALLLLAAPFLARGLNALALGEAEAFHLGLPVQRIKALAIVLVALAVGASVAAAGVIGFVGIVVPHLVRLTLGPDHAVLLPLSALGGAILLLGADIAARALVAPAELPIGIITALLGAPFFLWLLLRRKEAIGL